MPTYNLKISELITLAPNAKAVRIGLDNKFLTYQPGQFIMIELDLEATGKFKVNSGKKPVQKRPFSMSSTPLQNSFLEVTVKTTQDPFVSDYLINHLTVGESVTVTGPYGHFYFDEAQSEENIMLIGAGSGISPLMSIFRYISEKSLDFNVHLLYSNRTPQDILWKSEIETLSKENLTHEFTITDETWTGTQGRINKEMILRGLKSKSTDFYLCGPPEFVKAMEAILLEMEIKKTNIKKEIYN